MKVKTNQRKTIEKDYPYTLENLMKVLNIKTKKEMMNLLYQNKIAKYQSGDKFGMICPVIVPYDRFYNSENDLSLYQIGAHCALVITHRRGFLNCYPRFDEYTFRLFIQK